MATDPSGVPQRSGLDGRVAGVLAADTLAARDVAAGLAPERVPAWPPALDVPPAPTLVDDPRPTTRPGRATRDLLDRALGLAASLRREAGPLVVSAQRVRAQADQVVERGVEDRLAELPVERLLELVDGSVRLGALREAGVTTVADVLAPGDLTLVEGVGRTTVDRLGGAAHQLAAMLRDHATVRFDVASRPAADTALLAVLDHHVRVRADEPVLRGRAAAARATILSAAHLAAPNARGMLSRLWRRDGDADAAVVRLEHALAAVAGDDLVAQVDALFEPGPPGRDDDDLWAWFEADPAMVYGLLEDLAGLTIDHEAQEGHLPSEIVDAVRRQALDTSCLDVSLRGYQAFGARYALVQRRVLIGDEMGLGKTIVALAVAAHLWAAGERHVLVVCPASVLLNWRREVDARTTMPWRHLHGSDRDVEYGRWRVDGGVGITTFGTLGGLPGPHAVDLLVVDEAHYVKNPEAQRTRHVGSWRRQADRVVYLTGTPLENRVEEFRELVGQLRPDVAAPLEDHFALAGSEEFRRRVAPVYLRRNQEDVLTELPGRLEVEDWIEPTQDDEDAYRLAVASGNFQAMRQAAWVHARAGRSAKMRRLVELVEESSAQGWKVVVFSYFLGPLASIADGLAAAGTHVVGPMTGATAPADRLALVDDFTAHDGPAVLVAQIVAGGVGLNIQAASVVVLAEPQWKPSTEDQAIARAHRMGQVRRVNVHRLLVEPGVDQRMRELVEQKARIFDEYARQSSLADAAPDAVDRSEASMMQQILQEEVDRLGLPAPATT